jgi:hypothetical protein
MKRLVEELLLGPGKDRYIYCCPAEPRLSSGPAQGGTKTENGRLRRCFAESKNHQKTKNILKYPSRNIFDVDQQIW